ncbi:hypothetical protein VNI00_015825 [Paramarasmius palmivorus]|uniref:DUF6593 domain-containing protein n=1 Tax=Paramarasmius palmivorus TaxID=297713 RepID=A0AAW0BI73_9AGAR
MDLVFSDNNVRHTTITSLPSGQPVYRVSTTSSRILNSETATIKKISESENEELAQDIAIVKWHGLRDDTCRVRGRNVSPKHDKTFTTTKWFVASNGEKYSWKRSSNETVLRDQTKNIVATHSRSPEDLHQTKLSISQVGVPIVDDIVATFVLVEGRERKTEGASYASISTPVVAMDASSMAYTFSAANAGR